MSAGTNRIITPLILAFVLLTSIPTFAGQIIYVDNDGPADFNNIQAAIDDSNDGDVVIVTEGRYFENINFNGRNITLTSTDPCNPDVVAATIIDGSLNGSVVTFNSGEDANCVLCGFTITNGHANYGGGICCEASSPTITNCIITVNSATWGGGMFNNESSPTLTNCTFSGNSADDGGGMFNFESNPTLTNCTFNENSASGIGGGMENGGSSPSLTNCIFTNNSAEFGGGISNTSVIRESRPILTNCTFSGNSAKWGGGMINGYSNAVVVNCKFIGNSAIWGGGMNNHKKNPTITHCMFTGNSANWGGGMYNHSSSPTLTNCTFSSNSAIWGGGMENSNSNPTLINCTFSSNCADFGGGMKNSESIPTLTNCTFSSNSAKWGGGMLNYESSPTLTNSTFTNNSAVNSGMLGGNGGGMYNGGPPWSENKSGPKLTNCTFSDNSAEYGGGIVNDYSNPILTNCILWSDMPGEIIGTAVVTYSDVQGGWPGEGNIDADPCFVGLGYWDSNGTPQDQQDDVWIEGDYHLLTGSPCIDAGDPNYIAEPNATDLDGKPRVISGRIDMGAYEAPIFAEARIVPQTINLASKGNWITCHIWLPEQYNITDIDPNSVLLEDEIKPNKFSVDEQQQVATARFYRSDVQTIINVGEIELSITGRLTDGTVFEATDIIRVIDKRDKK